MNKGFTLIELLIVIAIIGTLSTMMFPNFLSAQDKAKEVAVKSVALSIQNALENYNIDFGTYPLGSDTAVSDLYQTLSTEGYLSRPPVNPFSGETYQTADSAGKILYSYNQTSGRYQLSAYKRDGVTEIMAVSNL
ncbi:MAG: prepilin-type N-terminal cleavage/methylation domain-containing protein [Candidatus Margulisiibacteriota bacterium]